MYTFVKDRGKKNTIENNQWIGTVLYKYYQTNKSREIKDKKT